MYRAKARIRGQAQPEEALEAPCSWLEADVPFLDLAGRPVPPCSKPFVGEVPGSTSPRGRFELQPQGQEEDPEAAMSDLRRADGVGDQAFRRGVQGANEDGLGPGLVVR